MTSQPTMRDHVVGQSTINKYPFYVSYLTSVGLSISCFIGLQGKKKIWCTLWEEYKSILGICCLKSRGFNNFDFAIFE